MSEIKHQLYIIEDKTSDEVLLINGFQHINQLIPYVNELQQDKQQLQNNWNELKKWCKENQYNDNFDSYQVDNYTTYGVILKKMQELE